jgi:hypothetical protein
MGQIEFSYGFLNRKFLFGCLANRWNSASHYQYDNGSKMMPHNLDIPFCLKSELAGN